MSAVVIAPAAARGALAEKVPRALNGRGGAP